MILWKVLGLLYVVEGSNPDDNSEREIRTGYSVRIGRREGNIVSSVVVVSCIAVLLIFPCVYGVASLIKQTKKFKAREAAEAEIKNKKAQHRFKLKNSQVRFSSLDTRLKQFSCF